MKAVSIRVVVPSLYHLKSAFVKLLLTLNISHYSEFVMALQEGFVRKDEIRQKMLIDELISTELPLFLGLIQQVLKDNGGKYLVGSEV